MKIFFLRYGKQSSLFLDRYSETKPFGADCNLAGGRRGAIKKDGRSRLLNLWGTDKWICGDCGGLQGRKSAKSGFYKGLLLIFPHGRGYMAGVGAVFAMRISILSSFCSPPAS